MLFPKHPSDEMVLLPTPELIPLKEVKIPSKFHHDTLQRDSKPIVKNISIYPKKGLDVNPIKICYK